MTDICSHEDKFTLPQTINHTRKRNKYFRCFHSYPIPVFWRKTHGRNLQIFLTLFWQIKIGKEVLMNV